MLFMVFIRMLYNFISLMTARSNNQEQQLQISEFIKQPASLKLLILAGTKVKPSEVSTINKCVSLIKLDLSSNNLANLPLKFVHFPALRILYLHDNQLIQCQVRTNNLEYISLFDNPIQNYRRTLIQNNHKLLAIDKNVLSRKEKLQVMRGEHTLVEHPQKYTQLKWPIVQISQELQQEEDYLNLLKAQLFVVSQVHKRVRHIDTISSYLASLLQQNQFIKIKSSQTHQNFTKLQTVMKAAKQWQWYAQNRKKLKNILKGTQCEEYTLSKIERARRNKSEGVGRVMQRFVESVRVKMRARKVLQRGIRFYRLALPAWRDLEYLCSQPPCTLYFLQSQQPLLQKLLLYSRKHFFALKQYDLCDNFDTLVLKTKPEYYIYRWTKDRSANSDFSLLQRMVKMSMSMVLGEKGCDKRSALYNRKGHKEVQIKRVKTKNVQVDRERVVAVDRRIQRMYSQYDTLTGYTFKSLQIYTYIIKLLRYFNAGNHNKITQTKAAYFQTEFVFQDKDQKENHKEVIQFSCHQLIQRPLAANTIQRSWRRWKDRKEVLREMKEQRARKLIGKWLRDMRFRHRMQLNKVHSFLKATLKQHQLYLHLDIYMSLPSATNLLDHPKYQLQDLYKLIHFKTQITMLQLHGRNWLKINFKDAQTAYLCARTINVLTYRFYWNGFHLRLFRVNQLNYTKDLEEYERKVKKMFGIQAKVTHTHGEEQKVKKIEIDNPQPFFLWPFVDQTFGNMFKPEQIRSIPISVFIYNKNRRPLKVNCDLLWTHPESLYYYKKAKPALIRVKTPKKQVFSLEQTMDLYKMPHMRHRVNRERQFSMKGHKSLLQANRQRGYSEIQQLSLLSETLNIKRG